MTSGQTKKLRLWFSEGHVEVVCVNMFDLLLQGSVPHSAGVEKVATRHGGAASRTGLLVRLDTSQTDVIRAISSEIRAITATRYDVNSWKHVCPRTAKSLERLADLLERQRVLPPRGEQASPSATAVSNTLLASA